MTDVFDVDGFVLSGLPNSGLHKLHLAIGRDDVKAACELLEQGVDPDIITLTDSHYTGLHIAVQDLCTVSLSANEVKGWGSAPELIKLLFEYKASVNIRDAHGVQPIRYLPTRFARMEPTSKFFNNCMGRVLSMLDLLLEQKADINSTDSTDRNNYTLLLQSYISNNAPLVEELLDRGAHSDGKNMIPFLKTLCGREEISTLDFLEKRTKLTETEW